MASVTATVQDFKVISSFENATAGTTKRMLVQFAIWNNGTAVAGGTDTLDIDVTTTAAAKLRNVAAASLTIRAYQIAQPFRNGATSTEYAATIGISSTTLQLTPKASSDWSTNATIPSTATLAAPGAPYLLNVLFDVA